MAVAILAIPTGDVVSRLRSDCGSHLLTSAQLEKNGMDAYMFLRFLRLLTILFGSITILTWIVLLPVNTVGLHNAKVSDGLTRLSWGKCVSSIRRTNPLMTDIFTPFPQYPGLCSRAILGAYCSRLHFYL